MTLQQIGDAVDATPSTISKLEKGQIQLTIEWMRKLAKALEVDPYELISDDALKSRAMSENAVEYQPPAGSPLKSTDRFFYVQTVTDDLADHPDRITTDAIVCFDVSQVTRDLIPAGRVVLITLFDRDTRHHQRGHIIGQFLPPNKLCSNRPNDNWMINMDDPTLPFDPVLRGVMWYVIRDANN